jgi:hypothetical protein
MESVIRVVHAQIPSGVQCLSLTYSRCTSQLTDDLIAGVDLFVLDLLRHYPGGIRAEGVALAHQLWKRGKSSLIISPLHCARANLFPLYWDAASSDSLENRIALCLQSDVDPKSPLMTLQSVFKSLLDLPPQH